MNTRRVKLRLESTHEKPLSGWQLQDFVNSLNKGYTKTDLINEIAGLLNSGIDPENIVIINESYEIYNQYKYLHKSHEIDLNNIDLVEKFYNLGKPFSMFPNEQIFKINLIFKLYEKTYTLFNNNKIPVLKKNTLKKYIELDFVDAVNQLRIDCFNLININEINENHNIYTTLNHYIEKAKKSYNNFSQEMGNMKLIRNLLENECDLVDYKDRCIESLLKKYYEDFFNLLKNVERPIVFIFNPTEKKMVLVKSEYMLNDTESDSFLDFKDYSHNSPFVINIIAGAIIVTIIYVLCKGVKQQRLNIEDGLNNEIIEDSLNKVTQEFINSVASSPQFNHLENVQNPYIKRNLSDIQNRVKNSTLHTLKQKGVLNDKMIVEYEESC